MGVAEEIVSGIRGKRFAIAGFEDSAALPIAESLARQEGFSRILPPGAPPFEAPNNDVDCLVLHGSLAARLYTETRTDHNGGNNPFAAFNRPIVITGQFGEDLSKSSPFVHVMPSCNADFLVTRLDKWVGDHYRRHFDLSGMETTVSTSPKCRVLVADDDPSMQALVAHVLQRSTFERRQALNGRQAIALSKLIMPDLIILDVNMPEMNGFRVLSEIRSDPGTRAAMVLLLTGRKGTSDIDMATQLGADMYVVKPIKIYEFRSRIDGLLAKRAS